MPAHAAETLACNATTEPGLTESIAQIKERLQRDWRESGQVWATHYRLEEEKANPFDPKRIAELKAVAGKTTSKKPAKEPPPIEGYASAFDVRCETSVTQHQGAEAVKVVFTAARLRFKEGRAAWSAVIRNAPIGSFVLTRAASGWTVLDLTAEYGALPPDARRSRPSDDVTQMLFEEPWNSKAVVGKGKTRPLQ